MRAIVMLLLATGCVDPVPMRPARGFDARVTYAGVRTEGIITFPSYQRDTDEPVTVDGAITGEAPIVFATQTDGMMVNYAVTLARRQDDFDNTHTYVECTIGEADVGHPVACMFSRHACSIVLEPQPVEP